MVYNLKVVWVESYSLSKSESLFAVGADKYISEYNSLVK